MRVTAPRLPPPPARYDPRDEAQVRASIERTLQQIVAELQQIAKRLNEL